MTTNYPNKNTNKENVMENNLIEDYFLKENNENKIKFIEPNKIKSLSFTVEKYAITQNYKNELNTEKIISTFLPSVTKSKDFFKTFNNKNTIKDSNERNSKQKSLINSHPSGNVDEFNESNYLTNFSNHKTNKFYVVKESELQQKYFINSDENTKKEKLDSHKTEKENLEALSLEKKEIFLQLKKCPAKKTEYLQNLIRKYNLNFSNNIIDLTNKNLGMIDLELISFFMKKESEKFECEEFKICNQLLSSKAMQGFSGFLQGSSGIKYLDISGCEIGDLGCRLFFEAFEKQKNLCEINLQKNNIGDLGAEMLSDLIRRNENISKIELEHNFIGNKGAVKLYDSIQINLKIKWLNLFGNISISSDLIAKISLQLKNNRISSRGKNPQMKYPES